MKETTLSQYHQGGNINLPYHISSVQGFDIETIKVIEKTTEMYNKMMEGSFEGAEEASKPFLKLLAKHVIQERKRLGQ